MFRFIDKNDEFDLNKNKIMRLPSSGSSAVQVFQKAYAKYGPLGLKFIEMIAHGRK